MTEYNQKLQNSNLRLDNILKTVNNLPDLVQNKPEEEKEVNISQNGKKTVVPTLGKTLSKVIINTQVPSDKKVEEEKIIEIKTNGQTIVTPSPNKVLSRVTVNTNTPIPKEEQEKVVTFSENGQAEVIPDIGKVLRKISVNVNVPNEEILNFSIIGSLSQPIGINNVIWIKTEKTIFDWEFSPFEPDHAQEGYIWIETGSSGHVFLNALKKNVIKLFLSNAYIYTLGSWQIVEAYIYSSGSWQEFSNKFVYFYNLGVKNVPWTEYYHYNFDAGSISYMDNAIKLSVRQSQFIACRTLNTIDISKYKKIYIDYSLKTNDPRTTWAFLYLTSGDTLEETNYITLTTGENIHSLDVSNVNLSKNIAVRLLCNNTSFELINLTIYRIWGEPR